MVENRIIIFRKIKKPLIIASLIIIWFQYFENSAVLIIDLWRMVKQWCGAVFCQPHRQRFLYYKRNERRWTKKNKREYPPIRYQQVLWRKSDVREYSHIFIIKILPVFFLSSTLKEVKTRTKQTLMLKFVVVGLQCSGFSANFSEIERGATHPMNFNRVSRWSKVVAGDYTEYFMLGGNMLVISCQVSVPDVASFDAVPVTYAIVI